MNNINDSVLVLELGFDFSGKPEFFIPVDEFEDSPEFWDDVEKRKKFWTKYYHDKKVVFRVIRKTIVSICKGK